MFTVSSSEGGGATASVRPSLCTVRRARQAIHPQVKFFRDVGRRLLLAEKTAVTSRGAAGSRERTRQRSARRCDPGACLAYHHRESLGRLFGELREFFVDISANRLALGEALELAFGFQLVEELVGGAQALALLSQVLLLGRKAQV